MRAPVTTLLLTLLVSPLMAQPARRTLDSARTRVWFEAGATMGAFQGTAQRVSGWVEAPDTAAWTGASGHVEIEVASFGTGIALRNRHLRDYMEAARYPRITFELDRVEPGGGREVTLHGRLTLKSVTREVRIPATIVSVDPLVVDGRLATRFTDWGMRPATRMGGLTRVRDPIVLRFHAVFP